MSGTANAQSTLTNPLLQETESRLEAGLLPPYRADYMKIVVAGLNIVLKGGASGFMAKLNTSKDPVADAARGAASLVLIMRKQAHGIMPMKAGIPAGMTLLLHGLDFIGRAGIMKIAEPELDRAVTIFTNTILHLQGITPSMIQNATAKVHQIVNDPASMAAIDLKTGATRHPMSAVPTPLPGLMNRSPS